jgi:prefoldin subunit 5
MTYEYRLLTNTTPMSLESLEAQVEHIRALTEEAEHEAENLESGLEQLVNEIQQYT